MVRSLGGTGVSNIVVEDLVEEVLLTRLVEMVLEPAEQAPLAREEVSQMPIRRRCLLILLLRLLRVFLRRFSFVLL